MMKKNRSQEFIKIYFVGFGMLIVLTSAAFAGYGYLHYVQAIFLMSSPVLLMQSYLFAAAIAFILTLLYNKFYSVWVEKLKRGDL